MECYRKRIKKCMVPGCEDITSKRHTFPRKDPELLNVWLQQVQNPLLFKKTFEQIIYLAYVVCDRHFSESDKVPCTSRGLRKTAFPTKFLSQSTEEEKKSKTPTTVCSICLRHFPSQPSLNRHYREVHGQDFKYPIACSLQTPFTLRCIETECSDSANNAYRTNIDLRQHLELFHGMLFETEHYVVNNMEDFQAWKACIEEETNARYFCTNKCTVSTQEIIYFKCNRSNSGNPIKSDAERKRALKTVGSSKMNISCTSEIRAIKENDKITVEWVKTHYGHGTDCPPGKRGKNCKRNIGNAESTVSEGTYRICLIDSSDMSQVQEVKKQRLTEEISASANPEFEHTDTIFTMTSISSPEEPIVSPESQKTHSINRIKKLIAEIGSSNFEKLDDSTINEIHCYLLTIANLAEFPNSSVPHSDQSIIKQELVEELAQQTGYELAETSFDTVFNDHEYC